MPAAVNINLLPVELSAKSGVSQAATLFRRISTAALIIFLIFGGLAAAFIIIFSLQINSVVKTNDGLKADIAKLEVTEQKNVLVKDRLAKIKVINGQSDILTTTGNIRNIVTSLASGVTLADANIDVLGKVDFSFKVADTSQLVSFLANLVANSNFKVLAIKNFSYNPAAGYLISLEAANK